MPTGLPSSCVIGSTSLVDEVSNNSSAANTSATLILRTSYVILEIAAANGIPYEVRRISVAEVFTADELLLTSSTKEVLPITQLDGKPVGTGKPGAIFARLHKLYQDFKRDVMRADSLSL